MPNHKTHEIIGVIATPLVAASAYYMNLDINHSTALVVGYIGATYYITPDLDIDSAPYYRWGILRAVWYPYKQIIPHRSIWSHSSIFSGTIRTIYFLFWCILLLGILGLQPLQYGSYYAILWLSIVMVDTLHTCLDFLFKN